MHWSDLILVSFWGSFISASKHRYFNRRVCNGANILLLTMLKPYVQMWHEDMKGILMYLLLVTNNRLATFFFFLNERNCLYFFQCSLIYRTQAVWAVKHQITHELAYFIIISIISIPLINVTTPIVLKGHFLFIFSVGFNS